MKCRGHLRRGCGQCGDAARQLPQGRHARIARACCMTQARYRAGESGACPAAGNDRPGAQVRSTITTSHQTRSHSDPHAAISSFRAATVSNTIDAAALIQPFFAPASTMVPQPAVPE